MSFPRYPKYKPSGVEWLGDVPEGWEVTALKRGYAVTLGKMLQPEQRDPTDTLLPYLRAANIQWNGVEASDIKEMWLSPRDRDQLRLIKGDLLISEGGDVGRSCVWQDELEECYFQNSVNRVRARRGNSNLYLYYWMSVIKDKGYVDVLCNKSTIAHFTAEKVAAVPVPFPPLPEQTAIAEFLDRETAKIDGLVAEQRRLMELLQEKRQAVISHAVTKGLNPNAPMKPSGIEWLGDVPQHWKVGPVKRFFESLNPRRIPLSGEERGKKSGPYPYYGASGIIDHVDEYIFDEDLILVSEDGANLLNRASPIAFVATGNYWVNNHAHILRPLDSNLSFWSARVESIDITPFVTGSAQPKFTSEALGALAISVPPAEERFQIQKHIEIESAKFDTLTAEAQRAIDLLQERRTALISAAVTGQIDVRQPPKN